MITDLVKGRRINPASERKANESNLIETEIWVPIRYNNFRYALSECGFDIDRAFDYAEKELFGIDGKPVFLPEQLSIKEYDKKKKNEVITEYMSYTKIMKLVDEKERQFYGEEY